MFVVGLVFYSGGDLGRGSGFSVYVILKEHSANRSPRKPSWLFFVFEFVNLVVLFLQFAECSFKGGGRGRL